MFKEIQNNLRNNSDDKSNNYYSVNCNKRLNSNKVSNTVSQKENIQRINNIEDMNPINNNRMNMINSEVSQYQSRSQSQSQFQSNNNIKHRFESGTISQNNLRNSSNINSNYNLNAYLINQLLEDRDRHNSQGMCGLKRDNFINRNSEIFLQSSNDPDFNFPEVSK
jgi:hypothetical protein